MENLESSFDNFYLDILNGFKKDVQEVSFYDGFLFYGHSDRIFLGELGEGFEDKLKNSGLELKIFTYPQLLPIMRENEGFYFVDVSWFIKHEKLIYGSIPCNHVQPA
tara:strand:- start:670 stop:990 length:321 start_codon:yes stop_codon:yes gene_type:complete